MKKLPNPEDMTLEELKPYVTEFYRRTRASQPSPRAKVQRPCHICGVSFGARELVSHIPLCRKAHAWSIPRPASCS
jgi:hypothetical protein